MFVEPKFEWDGDPATLTDGQLDELQYYLENMAVGEEEARALQQRRKLKLEGAECADRTGSDKSALRVHRV